MYSRSLYTVPLISLSCLQVSRTNSLVLKPGKVALITRGRYAGRKAVILKPYDDGTKVHPFGHALVAGIQRYPGKITARMGKKRIAKRSKVKPFIKMVNYNHLMPTRYALEGIEQLKAQIGNEGLKEVSQKEEAKKVVKKSFEEKFQVGSPGLGSLALICIP